MQERKETDGFASKIDQINNIKNDILKGLTYNEKSDMMLMKNELSTYGLRPNAEIDEFIAECVAEYLNGKPRVTAKNVVGILLKKE